MRFPWPRSRRGRLLLLVLLLPLLCIPAASVYYEALGGEACGRCHEIGPAVGSWARSSHRSVECRHCHGGLWTLDPAFHLGNLQRLFTHFAGELPERIRIRDSHVDALVARCRECHRSEFADWEAGPHGVAYRDVFLDDKHNSNWLLMDDCLRCHGMFFENGIRDVVKPLSTEGPWELIDPRTAERPAIPCLACHQMHRTDESAGPPAADGEGAAAAQPLLRPSLAFFDRRGRWHVPGEQLPVPEIRDGERRVSTGEDPRQGLCYQCHAPLETLEAGSGDDRTCLGVHEGLSCLACHRGHRQSTRASCRECHPRLSNCGVPVESMDTTFGSPESRHDIHTVRCADCHPAGIPARGGAEGR